MRGSLTLVGGPHCIWSAVRRDDRANGNFTIQRASSQGTRIKVTIPLNPTARENS